MNTPYLSLIIPAYNEAERIDISLEKIINYLEKQPYSYEILLVDDGSSDKTIELASKYKPKINIIGYENNRGKGAAVKYGMLNANGQFCVFSDADLSTPIYELEKLFEQFQKYDCDIVIGNRANNPSLIKVHQPFYREFMGKTFNKIVKLFVLKGITDTQCGFKGFKKEIANVIFSETKIEGFGFDVEILYLASKSNYKINQISVEWYNDERSKIAPIKDSFNMFKDILRIKKIHKNTVFPLKI